MVENKAKILLYAFGLLIIVGSAYWVYSEFQDKNTQGVIEGLLSGIAAFIFLIIAPIWRKKTEEKLRARGLRLEADLVRVDTIENENKKLEYIIVAKGRNLATGQEMEFLSDSLKADPTKYLPVKLTVLVDPDNPKKYMLDLDFLDQIRPKEAELEDERNLKF